MRGPYSTRKNSYFFHNQVFECEGHRCSMVSLPAMAGLSSMLGSLKAQHKTIGMCGEYDSFATLRGQFCPCGGRGCVKRINRVKIKYNKIVPMNRDCVKG